MVLPLGKLLKLKLRSTMEHAFLRTFQIVDFAAKFFIIGRDKSTFENKFNKILQKKPFNTCKDRYEFISYEKIIASYNAALKKSDLMFYQ